MQKLLFALLLITTVTLGQQKDYGQDVQSIDSIIAALYDVISGEDANRDWNRFNNLFAPEARLIPTFKNKEGKAMYRVLTPAEYVESFKASRKTGFYERELSRKTEQFGNIVHVFSSYETKEKQDGPVTMRGINSIQLFKSNDRFYVMQIFWSGENSENMLPEKYLKD